MKVAKSFRLSSQALEALRALREHTGASETALVEMALALLYRMMLELPADGSHTLAGRLDETARTEESAVPVQDAPPAPAGPSRTVVPGPVARKPKKRRKKRKKRR